jgi:hypothetical protein
MMLPWWKPEPIWQGQDVFIIGGGPSLRDFNWELLRKENTIGCNNAFRLGPEICKVCVFVDRKFLFDGPKPRVGAYDELAKFSGLVVTNCTQLIGGNEPWIKLMQRQTRGLHYDALGFNASAGATAINLALLLGAVKIYLLGFDMHLDEKGKPNWHNYQIDKPSKDVYARMLVAFGNVSWDLKIKFPNCSVINVTDDSDLSLFPKVGTKEFWANRKGKINDSTTQVIQDGVDNNDAVRVEQLCSA